MQTLTTKCRVESVDGDIALNVRTMIWVEIGDGQWLAGQRG